MKRLNSFLFLLLLLFASSSKISAASEITRQEAHDIGLAAYLYFYPLVTMDATRKQMTNIEAGKMPGFGPMNTFSHLREYPPAEMKTVVRPNFDTLYSISWLDLTQGPMIVSVPNTNGRYYLLPMLDMWTDVFASPGWRTTGTEAKNFAVTPIGWQGKLPDDVTKLIAPTPYVWIIGRIKTDGPADYGAVHQIQDGLKVTALSAWNQEQPAKLPKQAINQKIDMKTPPKEQIEAMNAGDFFGYAAELMKLHPPHLTDEPMMALLKRIGFERGKSFDLANARSEIKQGLESVPQDALKLMEWKIPTIATTENGWSMNTDTMGVYGNYYLKRAIVTQLGLGANLPEDAIYPLNLFDSQNKPLNGSHRYKIHFEKEQLPPVDAFWSITLYDEKGYQVENSLNRFALSSWMPFNHGKDGSLDLYFQHDSPGKTKEANWLPAPDAPFNLMMRLYAPKNAALVGKWAPPVVEEIDSASSTP